MGEDKSRLKLQGSTLLSTIRRTATELGLPVRIIRRDLVPRCGPLGGVYTGLVTSPSEAELFLACDMPFVDKQLLERIIARFIKTRAPIFTLCRNLAGFPLLLPRDMAGLVREQIDKGNHSLQELAACLAPESLHVERSEAAKVMNINTPADWAKAQKICDDQSHARGGARKPIKK